MKRREFLSSAGLAAAGAAAAAPILGAPAVHAQPKVQWRMATSWTPALDVLQGGAQRFARTVDEMSGGRLKIQVFAAGELIPALGVFDACSQGTIECYHSASYYYAGKEPAVQWFTAVPFGLNPNGMYAWHHYGDGIKLWEETYKPFNMVPRPAFSTGVQMGGWFRKKIGGIADYKGLKMRIPGLGGKVVARAGGTVVLIPGGEIYTALERGVIDACEWVGPHDDVRLGLHQTARHYYYPGWQDGGAVTEFVFNRKAYEALPADLQRMLDAAATAANTQGFMEYETKNAQALHRLRTEFKGKVEILSFPPELLKELRKLALDVVREESEKSPMARKVHASYLKFEALIGDWARTSEAPYQGALLG